MTLHSHIQTISDDCISGERPYKCNVCGNRFSTKGNLKVHFQRHKAKYPHIKMNPNPVPEHLDRLERPHPPMLVPAVPRIQEEPDRTPPTDSLLSHQPSHQLIESEKTPTPKTDPKHLTVNHGMKLEPLATTTCPKTPTAAEAPPRSSPNPRESACTSSTGHSHSPISSSSSTRPLTSGAVPLMTSSMGLTSPIHGFHHMSIAGHPIHVPSSLGSPPTPLPPFGMDPNFLPRPSILPSKMEDPLEQYMEVQKSETSKLEALVKNIETKLTDPNQCAICHRILSCKSALQMHYRTHTGERPFKCKICGRAFTTKGNLKTHMGVHRAKPPIRMMHQCPVCHKQFTNALVLQQHIRMHTGELPKDVPFPNPEMMMASPGSINFMPFPGFQFYPPGMPHHPHAFTGEQLDLRKASPNATHSSSEKRKLEDDDLGEKKLKAELEEGVKSESNMSDEDGGGESEEGCMDGETVHHLATVDENSLHSPLPEAVSTTGSDSSSVPHHKAESESKSPYSASMPTPPTLVPVREIPQSPSKPEYYSESSSGGNYPASSYSTSLMALEERVKAIDSMGYSSSRPLEQMENIIRRADPNASPSLLSSNKNGDVNTSRHSPSMPNIIQGESRRDGLHTPRSTSPTPSEGNMSHASFDSSKMSDSGSENPLLVSPGGLHMKSFGALDLSPNAFEAATGKPNTTCNICYKTFACRSALDIHYRSHTKERPFKCEVCDRAFSTKGNMKQHMLTHKIRDLPSQAFNSGQSCGSPSPGVPPKSEATSPAQAELKPRPTAAPPVTSSESGHGGGVMSQSSSSTPSASPFVRRPNLKHVCQVCQKPFSSASALQIHMRTHTGDKPFKCTVCGKAFTTKGNLKVHMGTHMWNNGPSRRGRRMSVEGIPALPPKEAEYLNHFAHRAPSDIYPFPFPGFPNGFPPKLNEISVIQSLNGTLNHLPPSSMPENILGHPAFPDALGKISNHEAKSKSKEESPKGENNNYPPSGNSGELDLSLKRSPTRRSPSPPSMSPEVASGWMYSTCHLCNKALPSMAALETHMKSHLTHKSEESSPKTLVAWKVTLRSCYC